MGEAVTRLEFARPRVRARMRILLVEDNATDAELTRACLDEDWLEQVQAAAGPATGSALEWVAASLTAHTLVGELHESTARISELVAAIKDYTHMDRAAVEDVDVHDGLDSTLTMLKYRIKHEPVKVERIYDRTLPPVTVHGSELNQVWTNLLTNALDAIEGKGDAA